MRGVERVRNLDGECEEIVDREPTHCQGILQRSTVQAFHRDERPAGMLGDLVDRADGGMIEADAARASRRNRPMALDQLSSFVSCHSVMMQ